MPRKPPEMLNRLDRKMHRQLEDYVLANYVKEMTTDVAFAKMAEEALGFPVTNHNVAGAREMFDIPSTRFAAREEGDIPSILRRLGALEQRVQVYIDGCCKDPRSPK